MEEQDKLLRRATVARILADRGDMLVVTGLGRRPTIARRRVTIRSISISGARWGARSLSDWGWHWRSQSAGFW